MNSSWIKQLVRQPIERHGQQLVRPTTSRSNRVVRQPVTTYYQQQVRHLSTTHAATSKSPVAIVGHGPVGVYLSALLSRYHVPNIIIEEGDGKSQAKGLLNDANLHPRAHVLHTRSMEQLRALGIEEQIWELSPPVEHWKHFRYCTTVLGPGSTLANVDHFDSEEFRMVRKASPSRLTHLAQPLLESVLVQKANECREQRSDNVSDVLFEHRFLGVEQDPTSDDLQVTVKHLGTETESKLQVSYLVGADGAHGSVRRAVGVPLQGDFALESFMSVHFTSKDLCDRILQEDSSAMLTFAFTPESFLVLVAHDLRKGSLVAHIPFFPPVQRAQDFDEEHCRRLLSAAVGEELQRSEDCSDGIPWTFHAAKAWGMHATCARRFSAMNERVFLVGDAAHQFPPSGGFGVNTGLGDAVNLGWKLALAYHQPNGSLGKHQVLNPSESSLNKGTSNILDSNLNEGSTESSLNKGTPDILKTYSNERIPVVQEALKLATDNYRRGLIPAQVLGLNRLAMTASVDALSLGPLASLIPEDVARKALDTISQTVSNVVLAGGVAENKRKVVEEVLDHQRLGLPMFFPMFDLGFSVKHQEPLRTELQPSFCGLHSDQSRYQPRMEEGYLLPHCWFRRGKSRVSSIDFVDKSEILSDSSSGFLPTFTVFVPGSQVKQSIQVLPDLLTSANELGSPWKAVVVISKTESLEVKGNLEDSKLPGLASVEVVVDEYGVWLSPDNWDQDGVPLVVVRPDGHIDRCTFMQLVD